MTGSQLLISLPPAISNSVYELEGEKTRDWFASHDPGRPLGSGGGTAHLLYEAWKASNEPKTFFEWLTSKQKVVVHSGGQSRRLPAYAAVGKALMPIPVERGSIGQRFDQNLLDLQLAEVENVLDKAGSEYVLAVLSGDVLLRPEKLPPQFPSTDLVCLGFPSSAVEAQSFGVFFCAHSGGDTVDFVLQKPSVDRFESFGETHRCLVDAGVWLFKASAVRALMKACGWDESSQQFPNGVSTCDLYSDFGTSLGEHPTSHLEETTGLSTAAIDVGHGFFHFGTNRQLLEAVSRFQSGEGPRQSDLGFTSNSKRRAFQHAQNTEFEQIPDLLPEAKVWFENCFITAGSTFPGDNIITNVPALPFAVNLPYGACLDMVPIGDETWCIRHYGFDDAFKGEMNAHSTNWMGEPVCEWLRKRGIHADFGSTDIQSADIFPVIEIKELTQDRLEWLVSPNPSVDANKAAWWIACNKISAQTIQEKANVHRIHAQRKRFRDLNVEQVLERNAKSVFFTIDLEHAAALVAESNMDLHAHPLNPGASQAQKVHERMFRSELARLRGLPESATLEREAFQVLEESIVGGAWLRCSPPKSTLVPDQVVWGRCPLRIDLGGGWTDTPPYGILYGGKVANVAIELNGQPPVQVFGRITNEPFITLRSIDVGTEIKIRSFEDLRTGVGANSEFSLAKTALALSGFTPQFQSNGEKTLEAQLEAFGGGLELTMLAAVPKGSGLGTSSILSGAILSTLSEMCGHGWSLDQVFERVSASEQMLTTGGGWQDQAGGLIPGAKLVCSRPGVRQELSCHWLPEHVLAEGISEGAVLLYYTGITRLAKQVLKEIVRGMFLNSGHRLRTLRMIGDNAEAVAKAFQTRNYNELGRAVSRSWELNQQLDSGTNPPQVARIYDSIKDYVLGAKLLGAGGGGFMLIVCKDASAAGVVRKTLDEMNSATGARFVDLAISQTGMQVSRS